VGAAIYAALALAAASVSDGIRTMSDDTYHHQVSPPLVHAASDAAYVLHSSGGAGIGGTIYAALGLVGSSLGMAIRTMSDDTYQHRVYPELIHAASDAGYVIHSSGGVGIGAAMIAVSIAVLRARSLPAWVAWLGVVAGIASIFSIFFFPWIVIAVWLVVAGVLLFVSTGRRASASVLSR